MITSGSNGQIKNLVKLQKSAKARKEQNTFVVEGLRIFKEIPKKLLIKAYITEEFLQKQEELLKDIPYEVVASHVLKEAADTKTPQGVIATVRMPSYSMEDVIQEKNPCLIVLENLQDPGNLGTIIRTGEGAGVSGILMSEDTVDLYNPKVVRSTMGSIFRMPIYVASMEEIFSFLEKHNILSYGAHLKGENFYKKNYKNSCAFFIGNEGNGLTEETTERVNCKIKIPMHGKVESLNAAIAGTVLMYEAMRQRNK